MKSVYVIGGILAAGAVVFTASAVTAISDTTTRDESGQITEAGDLGVYKMRVGDCVNDPAMLATTPSEPQEVSSFKAVPCTQTHTGEVTSVADDFYADEEYPGDEELFERAIESCVTALEEYTRADYQDSYFDTYAVYPSADTWKYDNDRGVVCIGLTVDEHYEPIPSSVSIKAA